MEVGTRKEEEEDEEEKRGRIKEMRSVGSFEGPAGDPLHPLHGPFHALLWYLGARRGPHSRRCAKWRQDLQSRKEIAVERHESPVRSVARTKCTNANFGPRDFPQQEVSSGRRGKQQRERKKGRTLVGRERERETGGTQASLIIGLNVANADFDESSGFECPLRFVESSKQLCEKLTQAVMQKI
ncbi:hypothetical protein G5I_13419 [Acromyrmex echinatior]|uniref:Uncharacterized protein n=1 Tax=Acromyrmex echinatior TaxID=103372 RepID=F4X4Z6_ACREC|nr:hypothetical protein G5I_13419 [Acromyrmex echinatior]